MAPVLLPRVDPVSTSSITGMSTAVIVGIAVVAAASVGLVIALGISFIYRRRRTHPHPAAEPIERTVLRQPSFEKQPLPDDMQVLRPPVSLVRSVTRRNLTPSIILPAPAARPRPPKGLAPTGGLRLSDAEIIAHHDATGTMPRAFAPIPIFDLPAINPPGDSPTPSAGPFSFALKAPGTLSPSLRTVSRPGSVVSYSRLSILNTSLYDSSFRSSLSSRASSATVTPDSLEVRHIFTPLLPDELVLRRGERVVLVQMYDDGWYIVGRRAAWVPKTPTHAFGHTAAHNTPDGVELGAVPAWVFQEGAAPQQERPMRNASLGVTLMLEESERRQDVVSWSNF